MKTSQILKLSVPIIVIFLLLVFSPFGIINPGETGIRIRLGQVTGTLDQGLFFQIPIIEQVKIIETRTKTISYDNKRKTGDETESSSLFAASRDLQDVQIATVVNYRLNRDKVIDIYTQYGLGFESNVVEPVIRETVKSVASQFTAEELVTKRFDFSDKVNTKLAERLAEKYVILEKFSVTNFEFSKTFTEAVERKATAEQEALASKNKLEQVKYEAEQQIAKAKAEAETIKIQSEAIQSAGGASYVQLKAIERWDGKLPTQFIPGQSLPFLNLR